MRRTMLRLGLTVSIGGVASLVFAPSAHAYIDPGAGSYIIQIIAASALAVAAAVGVFWSKLKTLFGRLFSKKVR